MTSQSAESYEERSMRSSLQIMGITGSQSSSVPGVGANLSRPASGLPDFAHVVQDDSSLVAETQLEVEPSNDESNEIHRMAQFAICLCLIGFGALSTTAVGAIITVLRQIGKPIPIGYPAMLVVGIVILVFSLAGLGHVLYGSHKLLNRACIAALPMNFPQTLHLPSFRWPAIQLPNLRLSNFRRRSRAARSRSRLPDPEEFELDDLGSQPGRPPTPYPGLARPVPIPPPRSFLRDGPHRELPFGFPVPPSGRTANRASMVSSLSRTSFQSLPFTVSPLSASPPTPPPREYNIWRYESREPLLPLDGVGGPVGHSEARASISTELSGAVQVPNPNTPIPSPQPTYPIELAAPSRAKEHEA
jgi:hypothetical protein